MVKSKDFTMGFKNLEEGALRAYTIGRLFYWLSW